MVDGIGATRYTYDAVSQILSEDGPWIDDTVTANSQSQRDCVLQPRVARDELPWEGREGRLNPKGVVAGMGSDERRETGTTLSGLTWHFTGFTQGSSSLATLGFATESLWDSQTAKRLMEANILNELTPVGATNFLCDANGILTNWSWTGLHGGSVTHVYDDENRLVAITTLSNFVPVDASFVYDGLGRMREQSLWTNSGGSWTQIGGIEYIYDGNRVIQERDGGNNPLVSYTRGNDMSGSLEGAGGIGGLLARSDGYASGTFSDHNFYHADGNGNITYMVNSAQTLAASYRYDPFGNLISSSGSLAPTNTYRFSSKEFIPSVGLYYYLYRFYDPGLQRWLNRDPISDFGFFEISGLFAGRRVATKRGSAPTSSILLEALVFQHLEDNLYTFSENQAEDSVDSFGLLIAPIPHRPRPKPCSQSQCEHDASKAWDVCSLSCLPLAGAACFLTPAIGGGVLATCETTCAMAYAAADLSCGLCPLP